MRHLRRILSKSLAFLNNRRAEAELQREVNAHLALLEEDFLHRGMSVDEARLAARRAYGGVEQAKQLHRDERSILWLEHLTWDIRFAFRQLRKSPGFAFTAILTVMLGIGAATSVFSVVNAVLLKPLTFQDPNRLVVLREAVEREKGSRSAIPVNYRHFVRLKTTSTTIEDAAIFLQGGSSVSINGDHPRIVGAVASSPNLFEVLGVQPILGRGFAESDAKRGAANVVLLSYEAWQSFFGGNPNAVGKTLRIDGGSVTVIGVLPATMRFPRIALAPKIAFQEVSRDPLLFQPLVPSPRDLTANFGNFNYKVIARLKPNTTLAKASAEMEALQNAYTLSEHLPLHFGIALNPLEQDVAAGVRGALWLLFAAVGGVLLIACINLANLQLARALNAEREIAVRAALGAGRAQLVSSRLTESIVLGLIGGSLGAALSFGGVRFLLAMAPADVPRIDEVLVNVPVLLFAAGISIAAAVVFGILPALRSLKIPPQSVLQASSARSVNTKDGRRIRNTLVVMQVACTLVLLIVTSLVLRSFSNLLHQNRGFDSAHLTLAQVDLSTGRYYGDGPAANQIRVSLADRVLGALRALPGVQAVALTSAAPLTGETWVDNIFRPDHPVAPGKEPLVNVRWINPDYLPAMRSRLVAGRNFTDADRKDPRLALISEKAAQEGFPGENPIGHKITKILPDDSAATIVGIVADARINGLKDAAAMVYLPYWANTPLTLSFLIRSSRSSDTLVPEIRRAIWQIDSQVAIPALKTLDDQLSDSVSTDRFQAVVLTSFGVAALLLALLGVYGVLAYSVSLRKQEFGIRIALGSGRRALMGSVLLQAASPVLFGAFLGFALAFVALHWVRSLLFETPLIDPVAIGTSVALVLAVATLAATIPARRAAASDPMRVLRME